MRLRSNVPLQFAIHLTLLQLMALLFFFVCQYSSYFVLLILIYYETVFATPLIIFRVDQSLKL